MAGVRYYGSFLMLGASASTFLLTSEAAGFLLLVSAVFLIGSEVFDGRSR